MAVTGHVFPQWLLGVNAGNIAMTGGTYKVALGNAAGPIALATAGISTAKLFSDWTSIVPEITGTGYTAGGATVASPTFTAGGTSNSVTTWTSGTDNGNFVNVNLSGATLRYCTNGSGITTALPTPITPSANTTTNSQPIWVGVS